MERQAHYALVGAISTAVLVLTLLGVMALARFQFTRAYDVYDIDFQGPVRGLSSGGEVFFNGIKVGEVTRLRLDAHDPDRVVARVRTDADAPVRTDTTASLEPLGVTGVNYVLLTAGTRSKPLLKDVSPPGVVPVVHARAGQFEALLAGGGTVLTRTIESLDRVNRLLSDRNVAAVGATLSNVADLSAQLRQQKTLLGDLDATLRAADTASTRVAALAQSAQAMLAGPGNETLAKLADTATQVRATALDLRATVATLTPPAQAFATTGLPQISRAVVALQTTAENLDRLVGEVEQNPRALIGKPTAKTVDIEP